MKRFYKTVALDRDADGWLVRLDGRPLPSPGKATLRLAQQPLAQRLADEWAAQGDKIQPASMPTMAFLATAIDRVRPNREAVINDLTAYAASDLLAYWAERPDALVALQAKHWQPVIDWSVRRFPPGLQQTAGVVPIDQDPALLTAVAARLAELDDLALNAAAQLCQCFGSTLLALAVIDAVLDIEAAISAAFVDERHQQQVWGYDKEADDRLNAKQRDARSIAALLPLLGPA